MEKFWGRKTFLLVTGASKGMGKECAVEFSKKLGAGSAVMVAARTLKSVEPVRDLINDTLKSKDVLVSCFAQNLEEPKGHILEEKMLKFFEMNKFDAGKFDHAIVVHGPNTSFNINAEALDLHDHLDLNRYFSVNAYGPAILNAKFMKFFKYEKNLMRTIVNISSDLAQRPIKSLSTLCAASTARESFMCSVAKENPHILVLNYDPGFVDVHVDALKHCKGAEVRQLCKQLKANASITTCSQTVAKLMTILEDRLFLNGEHVSYWDFK